MISTPVRWSPSDLVDHLACAHITTLERAVRASGLDRPPPSEEASLVFRNGRAHEERVVAALRAAGKQVVEIAGGAGTSAAAATLSAMRRGAEVIHGAVLHGDDGFTGVADLLERVERPSALGGWSYDVADVKLAAGPRPEATVQLCAYAARVEALQHAPVEFIHLVLGDGRRATYRTAIYAPYARAAEARFRRMLEAWPETRPRKNAHCERCRWDERCSAERRAADDLADVAFIRATQVRRLIAAGVPTLSALADAPPSLRVPRLPDETLAYLREQARLQAEARRTGVHRYAFRAPRPGAGFARLPAPDPHDVWFDMEGDPLHDGGALEYLFGATMLEDGVPVYRTWWAHDRDEERAQFEAFVDTIVARRAAAPAMHVYHYAPYEPAALVRLAGRYATREDAVDELLRVGVFVDLYAVVREALVLSTDDYSIKRVETFYRPKRHGGVTTSMGSVVAYEAWRLERDEAQLDAIAAYNNDDCDSTRELDRWLRDRAREARAAMPDAPWDAPVVAEEPYVPAPAQAARLAEIAATAERLTAGDDDERRQIGHALTYHRREARPGWREYFERLAASPEDLVDDVDALGALVPLDEPPVAVDRSLQYALHAPPQETKIAAGKSYTDPQTGATYKLIAYDAERGRVVVQRGRARAAEPLPRALVAGRPIVTPKQQEALRELAEAVLTGSGRFRAARALAAADPPRRTDGRAFRVVDTSPAALAEQTVALAGSYLVVQGPPGTGKTWTGARLIVALLERGGVRIGVTSRSHRAIHHLLHEVEAAAAEAGVRFDGVVKTNGEPYVSATGAIADGGSAADLSGALAGGAVLIAGTSFALTDATLRESLDVLVVDEAGQVALADALAVATCADRVVLLGDPRQLPHVGRGSHPDGTDVSILTHLLGDDATIPPERGAFLATTYRLHPDVARFVSELMYDGRLVATPPAANRVLLGGAPWDGAGLRHLPVEHDGNSRASHEEAEAIAAAIDDLLGRPYADGAVTRPLRPADVIVVAPYNLQVRCIRAALAARGRGEVRVGTVDLFQGQEAAVVFFSMTTSSGDDLPRGVDFLFSRERLNVAISRARTLAVLAYAPALLATRPRSVEDVALIAALARFVECAEPIEAGAPASP